jgi:3-methyladenine DNA glycosylase/8-oxoguanine DNA glycosylase
MNERRHVTESRTLRSESVFGLATTAAPVAWGRGKWPNVGWRDGVLTWVGWESGIVAVRQVRQADSAAIRISGSTDPAQDRSWADSVLGFSARMPEIPDPVIADLARRFPGLRPFANGSLFEGIVGSIIGQSISVASAAAAERRLAGQVHSGVEVDDALYFPAPRIEDLAIATPADVRQAGVTWRRAEAIVAIARAWADETVPPTLLEGGEPEALYDALRTLPLVGPWTARSALLWGLGLPDIYPAGDVALLRAARCAFADPEMSMARLDDRSESWRPSRSWAARLLWLSLLGPAT